MADDVVVPGGLYPITFRNALAEADDAVTGDKTNLMNMALARGCWFQWEYTVQIDFQTDEVVTDLGELGRMKDLLTALLGWTPEQLDPPVGLSDSLNQLFQWGAGSDLTNQASEVRVPGMSPNGIEGISWPARTRTTPNNAPSEPIGSWENLRVEDFSTFPLFVDTWLYQSADGVYFRVAPITPPPASGPTHELVRIEREDIELVFDNTIVASDGTIAKARRELEIAIESKTQRNQEKQARLQDLAAALQRWITFTTNLNERKKRDADSIAGNFH